MSDSRTENMAESIGVAISGLSLATLFTNCIECMELFHLAQNFHKDYQIAAVKMILLKARLNAWGNSLGITEAGKEPSVVRCYGPAEKEAVAKALLAIKMVFEDSDELEKKYGLRESTVDDGSLDKAMNAQRNTAFREIEERFRFATIIRQSNTSIRQKMVWAIFDKKKFDVLIGHIAFFIDQLESLSLKLNVADIQQKLLDSKIQAITNRESISLLEAASAQSDTPDPLLQSGQQQMQSTSGHIFLRNKIQNQAKMLQGDVGMQGQLGRSNTYKENEASDYAQVIQGNVAADAAIAFFK